MDRGKKRSKRLAQRGRKLLRASSFRINQYKQVVQKRIDLGALQKRLEQLHTELGAAVAQQHLAGQRDPLANREVSALLEKIRNLNQTAQLLEAEIEQIRSELPDAPPPQPSNRAGC